MKNCYATQSYTKSQMVSNHRMQSRTSFTYSLELHISYFRLHKTLPGETIDLGSQRGREDLTFLNISAVPSQRQWKYTLCESHISLVVLGFGQLQWNAYGFRDRDPREEEEEVE